MGMWGSLASRLRLAPRFTDFFTDFEKKKQLFCSLRKTLPRYLNPSEEVTLTIRDLQYANI